MSDITKKAKKSFSDYGGVKTIHNAVGLLRAVVKQNDPGVSVNDLSNELGLHIATVRRMARALAQEGLLMYNSETRLYHLGLELYSLGSAARQFGIRDIARPILQKIAHETQDTVYLGLKSGNDLLSIDKMEGTYPLRALTQEIGSPLPLGIDSGSLAILAFLPASEIKKILRANQKRYPKYNNRSAQWVREQIPVVQMQGYAVGESNVIPWAAALGAPILNSKGVAVASISVSTIVQRMSKDRQRKIGRLLKREIASVHWDDF